MPIYVTEPHLQSELNKKVDKTSVVSVLSGTPQDTNVPSEKLVSQLFHEVTYPANLEKCLNEFDNMYLGYKAIHPTLDINGMPLTTGLMYFNTTDKILYIFDGTAWDKTINNVPNVTLARYELNKFDVEATGDVSTIGIPNGYNPNNVVVYLNGIRMSSDDYTADNGTTITFSSPIHNSDVVSGFSATDDIISNFDMEANTTTATVTVPNGYDPSTLSVYLNGVRMSLLDYTAIDGSSITFKNDIYAGDVVSGTSFRNMDNTVPIVTEYAKIEDAPNPAMNGALAFDISRKGVFYYSATAGAWIGNTNSTGANDDIEFYDKKAEFPDPTIAILDKLYVDRSTKNIYMFDGSRYIPYGLRISSSVPTGDDIGEGALYVNTTDETIGFYKDNAFHVIADGKSEPIQVKAGVNDFIYTGVQKLFLDATGSRLYHYDGLNFVPIKSAGAGNIEFIDSLTSIGNAQNTLFLKKDNGKLYYYDSGATKRANKEIWRVATATDLTTAIKDEDFIYLVDDENVLKKWDAGLSRFENLGTPKVTHHFVSITDLSPLTGNTPSRGEVETYAGSKGWTDCLVWGNGGTSDTGVAKWVYSVEESGKAIIVYSQDLIVVNGFASFPTEQTIGGDTLIVEMTNGVFIVKDGNGATLNTSDNTSDGNLSDGQGMINVSINGVKIPNVDITIAGNTATISTSRVIENSTLYVGNFIEIIK